MKSLPILFSMFALFLVKDHNGTGITSVQTLDKSKAEIEIDEKEIQIESLPYAIKNAIAVQYPGAELLDADEITHIGGKTTFDVEIKHNGKVTELMYEAHGRFLGEEEDEGDEENEAENGGDHP